jgi:hypothetical protein
MTSSPRCCCSACARIAGNVDLIRIIPATTAGKVPRQPQAADHRTYFAGLESLNV